MIETTFLIVNTLALISWILLIVFTPKFREYLYKVFSNLVFPFLALIYGVLIISFFQVSGGGFDSFENVKKLLSNDWVLLAGWIHYLIFDLFVGVYIAKRLDKNNIDKLFQGIILLITFMFGPLGWLIYFLFEKLNILFTKYIYKFYKQEDRIGLENKIYSYTLFSLTINIALWPVIFLASFIDTRTIADVNVWVKPLKFIYSLSLHFLTILLVLPLIQKKFLESKTLLYITLAASYSLTLEIIYIVIQALRGRASHFNDLTQLENIMYGLMGAGAVVGIIGSFAIGYYVYKYAKDKVSFGVRFGTGVGLMLGSILTFFVAGYLGSNGSHFIDKSYENINLLPFFGWSMVYGDLRVPHFFALHAMQFLVAAGFLTTLLNKKYERLIVYSVTLLVLILVAFTLWQALNDIPFISL